MLDAASSGLEWVIASAGDVVSALVTEAGSLAALLPLFGIGVGVSAFFMAMKAIRGVTWGA